MTEATVTQTDSARPDGLHYVVFVHLTALPSWLRLDRDQRAAVVERDVTPLLAAHPAITARWVDVEAFTAECSDIWLVETQDLREWNHLFEALRDTSLFADPYFRLDRILIGAQDGFQEYEASAHDRV